MKRSNKSLSVISKWINLRNFWDSSTVSSVLRNEIVEKEVTLERIEMDDKKMKRERAEAYWWLSRALWSVSTNKTTQLRSSLVKIEKIFFLRLSSTEEWE